MKSLTFSIIGCQHPHIEIFIQEMLDMGHKCKGIYEKENIELTKIIADKFNIDIKNDLDSLLSQEVNVVGSAAINNRKVDIIEMCEKYGKDIMVDKPLVTNKEDFERVKEVIDRNKIQVGMLLTERFRPSLYTLKQKVIKGELGKIVSIEMRKPHLLKPFERPKWHFSKEECGGIIIDLFVHDFDLLHWITSQEIGTINGYVSKNILPEYPEFYDTANLQVLLNKGIIASLYADWHTPEKSWTWGDGRIFVVGTKGTAEIRAEGDPFVSSNEIMIQITHDKKAQIIELQTPPITITKDFLNRIDGKRAIISHEDILNTTNATLVSDDKVKVVNNIS